jgi:hypothetical protein
MTTSIGLGLDRCIAWSVSSSVRDLVLGLIKKTGYWNAAEPRRWFAGHIQEASALLVT